jgi:hypothetical protein
MASSIVEERIQSAADARAQTLVSLAFGVDGGRDGGGGIRHER